MHVLACTNQLVHMLVYADYAYGERKFGGNAQAITKQRWLHHTSLLWDFSDARMRLLKHPSKAPEYRAVRLLSSAPLRLWHHNLLQGTLGRLLEAVWTAFVLTHTGSDSVVLQVQEAPAQI